MFSVSSQIIQRGQGRGKDLPRSRSERRKPNANEAKETSSYLASVLGFVFMSSHQASAIHTRMSRHFMCLGASRMFGFGILHFVKRDSTDSSKIVWYLQRCCEIIKYCMKLSYASRIVRTCRGRQGLRDSMHDVLRFYVQFEAFCGIIQARLNSHAERSIIPALLPYSTVSNEPLPTVEGAASGPFCARSFSSNFSNSFMAVSSSWSMICCTPLTSSM